MLHRKPCPPLIHSHVELDDIVLLWTLRILVPLGGYRRFIEESGFSDDALALAIGLGHWLEPDAFEFDRRKAIVELRKLHERGERELCNTELPSAFRHNVNRLTNLIGLSDTAQRVLEFAVILHITPLLDEAFDMLGAISSLRLYYIIAVLLELPEDLVKVALSSQGQLVQSGLVTVDHSGALSMSSKLDLLTPSLPSLIFSSAEDPLTLLREVITPCAPPELTMADFHHIQYDLDIAVPYLAQAVRERRSGVNIFIHGHPGTGKSQLARLLAAEFNCVLYEVASEDNEGNPITGENRLRALRAAQNILSNQKSLLLFDEVEDIFGDGDFLWGRKSTAQTRKGWLNSMLEGNPVPTLWLSNSAKGLDPAFVRRFDMVFELPIPPRRQRELIFRNLCDGIFPQEKIARIATAEALAPAVVERAAKVVRSIRNELSPDDIPATMERLINNTLVMQGHPPLNTSHSATLPAWYEPGFINTTSDLTAITDGLARNRSGRLCLYGPSGTGKTAYGCWLADRLELPLLVKRGSDLLDMYVGGTEQNIARAFREAESDGALLLIDEVDSFLQERRNAKRSWEVTEVNEVLTQMEGFNGIFIASTNLMQDLDQAALRRFDLKLKFDYLLPKQAWRMFELQCSALGLLPPDEILAGRLNNLSTLTPGDFATAIRQHRFQPFAAPHELLAALEEACALKDDGPRRPIGFI